MTERYVTKIEVQNFKSHKHTVIHPGPPGTLTVLSGPSDAGKSSFLHAEEWLDLNNWDPSYLRHGAKFSQVSKCYSDGYIVTIRRQKSGGTTYTLTYPDGQKQVFEGFGRGVPQEIQAITGVHVVEFGADASFALNFQRQDAGPFLGRSISSPGRARILGALAGTEEIDLAARMLSTQLTSDRQKEKRFKAEVEDLDIKIAEYDYLESLSQTIQEVSGLIATINRDTELKNKLTQLKSEYDATLFGIQGKETEISYMGNIIDQATPLLQTLDQQTTLYESLSTRFTRLTGIQTDIEAQDHILKLTRELPEAAMALQIVEQDAVDLDKLLKLDSELQQVHTGIDQVETILAITSGINEAIAINSTAEQESKKKDSLTRLHTDLQKVNIGLEDAGKVIALTEDVNAAQGILESLVADSSKLEKLINLSGEIGKTHTALCQVEKVLNATRCVSEVELIVSNTLQDFELYGKLVPLQKQYLTVRQGIRESEEVLNQTAGIEEAEKLFAENEKSMDLLATFFGLQLRRDKISEAMEAVKQEIEEAERQVAERQDEYVETLREMGVCELCGSDIQEENLRRVI